MSDASPNDQLIEYLRDAHAIEEQAIPQMRMAPKIAGDAQLAEIFKLHLEETERHESRVRTRLEVLGAGPSRVKDAVFKAGGVGFALFARLAPDSTGKLVAHAYSYEHLELAGYELLMRLAGLAGDRETAALARSIRD